MGRVREIHANGVHSDNGAPLSLHELLATRDPDWWNATVWSSRLKVVTTRSPSVHAPACTHTLSDSRCDIRTDRSSFTFKAKESNHPTCNNNKR
jgi:hypothetical protein